MRERQGKGRREKVSGALVRCVILEQHQDSLEQHHTHDHPSDEHTKRSGLVERCKAEPKGKVNL